MQEYNVNYHSSIILGDRIFIDPLKIPEKYRGSAEYVFITHPHHDHLSLNDISVLVNKNTKFICTADVMKKIRSAFAHHEITVVKPNTPYVVGGLKFSTTPAYNLKTAFHPRADGWVGYIIETGGKKYAILGDTDNIDELHQIKCDVLFVPVGGTYTMTAHDAATLTNIVKPVTVVPVHYGSVVGAVDCGKEFATEVDSSITINDILASRRK